MKRKFRFVFICLFTLNFLSAQNYFKIPVDTNYYWRQQSKNFQYQIRYAKDTVISSKTYNKYSLFGSSGGGQPASSFRRHGYLRQDTLLKKVVILDDNFTERPLYNFTKAVGDTLLSYKKPYGNIVYTVTSRSGQTVNDGSTRIVQSVYGVDGSNGNVFIEGIGAWGGIFGARYNLEMTEFICFGKLNPQTTLYEIGDGCVLYDAILTYVGSETKKLKIYPNPTSDYLYIKSELAQLLEIKIYDALGSNIYQGNGDQEH